MRNTLCVFLRKLRVGLLTNREPARKVFLAAKAVCQFETFLTENKTKGDKRI